MFESTRLHCPACGIVISAVPKDGREFTCRGCRKSYRTLVDDPTGRIGLIDLSHINTIEPLGLPKGSIRATVSLTIVGSCWGLVMLNRNIPEALLSLILAIIGYYFGFRIRPPSSNTHLLDPAAPPPTPLYLPGGVIRGVLITGFLVMGLTLRMQGRIWGARYLEFFVILMGLICGFLFSRGFGTLRGSGLHTIGTHTLGVLVLIGSGVLGYLFLSGTHASIHPLGINLTCALVTFYFGSRS